jgi:hypothetical protein
MPPDSSSKLIAYARVMKMRIGNIIYYNNLKKENYQKLDGLVMVWQTYSLGMLHFL